MKGKNVKNLTIQTYEPVFTLKKKKSVRVGSNTQLSVCYESGTANRYIKTFVSACVCVLIIYTLDVAIIYDNNNNNAPTERKQNNAKYTLNDCWWTKNWSFSLYLSLYVA